jgi:hypothetical protein
VKAPGFVEIPSAQTGCRAPVTYVEIQNDCATAVQVHGHRFVLNPCDGGACPELVLTQTPAIPSTGYRLEPGDRAQYGVRPSTTSPGNSGGVLEIELVSDSLAKRTVRIEFAFTATPQAPTRTRIEYYMHPADVLFIVDNSARMAAWSTRIRDELAYTMDAFAAHWRPFRVAITTADVSLSGLNGRFIDTAGGAAIIGAREAGARDRLLAKFDGILWNAPQPAQPLQAMAFAFSSPLADGPNAGFLSPYRATDVLVFTDGDDHSLKSVAEYVSEFRGAGGAKVLGDTILDSRILAAMSFVEPRCSDAPLSGRLAEVVYSSGGLQLEICDSSWRWFNSVFEIYDAGLPKYLCLGTGRDQRQPLVVWFDGIEVPAVDGSGQENWRYDSVDSCVVFAQALAFQHPSVVEYEYTPAPTCAP